MLLRCDRAHRAPGYDARFVLAGLIRALPAAVTDRACRFRRTSGSGYMYDTLGTYTLAECGPGARAERGPDILGHSGLDLSVSMFAPCLLVRTDPAILGLSKRSARRPMRGHAPRNRAAPPGRRH